MTKSEFEDLLRRAGERDFFLIGSQAIRGISPAIPRDFPKTLEADLYPRRHPQAWGLLRSELGNASKFFKRRGYYLDCTDPGLAALPDDWTERLIPFRTPRTGGTTAWCLDPNDLFASKPAAGRDQDRKFLLATVRHKFARPTTVRQRIEALAVPKSHRQELVEKPDKLVAEFRSREGGQCPPH
jgi:hypothetical protein